MKRKIFCGLLALTICLVPCLGATACGEKEPEHIHSFTESWSTDEAQHWHAAICEHTDERSGLAAHTPAENGKCTVCGYRTTSITLREFASKAECQKMAQKFTHEQLLTSAPELTTAEMIWFTANEKDELTRVDVVYLPKTDSLRTVRYESFGFNPIDLDDVAEGIAQKSTGGSHGNEIPFRYDTTEQTQRTALWNAVYQGKVLIYGNNTNKLITLFYEKTALSLVEGLRSFEIFELDATGFGIYNIQVRASSNATDEELIELLKDRNNIFDFKKNVYTFGTNVYTGLKSTEDMQK